MTDLASAIRPGDGIILGQACAEPQTILEGLVAQRSAFAGCRIFLGASYSGIARPEHADFLRFASYGGIGQNRDDVMRPATDAAQGVANGLVHGIRLSQVGLDQVGNHAAGGEFGGSAGFQGAAVILGNPAHQHSVSRNFASQLRPGSGLWKSTHLWGLSQS